MKKIILLSIIFLSFYGTLKSQVYRYIPDANFRFYLSAIGCPFDSSGDSLDISSTIVTTTASLSCSSTLTLSIEGVQYFTALTSLECFGTSITSLPTLPVGLLSLTCWSNYGLTSLPTLPAGLTSLTCYENSLTSLPPLPSTLKFLDCNYNYSLGSLPSLPDSLTELSCEHTGLTSLPPLPSGLTRLFCSGNSLTSLPSLPSGLRYLNCMEDSLTSLPSLPSSLRILYCPHNLIMSLPSLPGGLTDIDCRHNLLTSLPALPYGLLQLRCAYNDLTALPVLPDGLTYLTCDNNLSLSCLPLLPSTILYMSYDTTGVTCLPNFVSGAGFLPPLGTHPFCNPLIHSCPSYVSIVGTTYFDNNTNCNFDTIEPKIHNINIQLKHDTTLIQSMSTLSSGMYAFDALPNNTYTVHIDTTELPYYASCIVSSYDTVIIDTSVMMATNLDIALQCKPGFDLGTTGLNRTGQIRPATPASFALHAGDMASLFGAHCTSISGMISLDYSGPMHYTGVVLGALVPDSILPNRLVWNIADFSTLDFNHDLKPNFFVDSSAILGDLVCFTTNISPIAGDRVPSNNTFSQCFEVRASYDPNVKEVSPAGSVTASQDWLYYTIHFQNTGNSFAENIYVWDTINANLDLNTIQVMSSSHDQFMRVYSDPRAVKFNFKNINLTDSTSDEPASHGYVQYRIKLKSGLGEGTSIQNTASILFDLNSPVVTNTTNSNICNSSSTIKQHVTVNDGQTITVGSHHYSQAGVYTDILTNIHGCDSVVTTTIQIISGIENISPSRILCYPNPANHSVLVQLEGLFQEPLVVFDMYGRKIFSGEFISNKYIINTESFSEGTYIIQCGNKHQKLVVKH